MARVLIVDFEEDTSATLTEALRARGHAIHIAAVREAAVAMWKQRLPDVVVVDASTAENDTFDPWRTLKTSMPTSTSQLVVLARSGWRPAMREIDAVFEKPFRVNDFCECVEALTRVRLSPYDDSIECGVLRIDRRTGAAIVAGEEVDFTPLERKLLVALYDHRPAPVSRGALLHSVWGMHEDLDTRTIDTHVRRVRVKLGDAGGCIVTVRGSGFAFDERAAAKGGERATASAATGAGRSRETRRGT